VKVHKTVDAENARHLASQLAKQVVVLQINLVRTQKNNLNSYIKGAAVSTALFYAG